MEDKYKTIISGHNQRLDDITARFLERESEALQKYHEAVEAVNERYYSQLERNSLGFIVGLSINLVGLVIAMVILAMSGV